MQDFITAERDRLTQAREALVEKRHNLQVEISETDRELAAMEREFEAVKAYELAKSGKLVLTNRGGATTRRAASNGAPRTRKPRDGSRRNTLLSMIANAPSGMGRGDLIYALGVKGDKAGEMSISNALTSLTKSGQLVRHEGKYFASGLANEAALEPTETAEQTAAEQIEPVEQTAVAAE